MTYSPEFFLGLDPTAGRNPLTWALLDAEGALVTLAGGELEQVLPLAAGLVSAMVAVNSPSSPNLGLVRERLAGLGDTSHPRGAELRLVEYLLRERGISVPPTPAHKESCAAWTQLGFRLYAELGNAGYHPFPAEDTTHQLIETNPHAVFCSLLGQLPLPKPTLEGRLQRQLVLHSRGAGISDPMDFFEEITRHKLLCGRLPVELVYAPEELDALAAAFTAWQLVNAPKEILLLGDLQEGQMVIPVKELKERYS